MHARDNHRRLLMTSRLRQPLQRSAMTIPVTIASVGREHLAAIEHEAVGPLAPLALVHEARDLGRGARPWCTRRW